MNEAGWVGGGDVSAAMLRIVKGAPDEIELAALVAGIVAARSDTSDGPADGAAGGEPSAWDDHGRRLGIQRPGNASWRWSLHP